MFKFRSDNREKINQGHVERLAKSIQSRNLLEFRPIQVNADYEVIDGQNRLKAAEMLGVDIYYEMSAELTAKDIITLNVAKTWQINDYLNFYVKNGYSEYQKLDAFCKKHGVGVKLALGMLCGHQRNLYAIFKDGEFQFKDISNGQTIDLCWQTIDYIKKMVTRTHWVNSSRFWNALVQVFNHHNFNSEKWMSNLEKHITKVGPRADGKGYIEMLLGIHNWSNKSKINMDEDE
jgi:hypothetical protein